jgi:hypothetical protein
MMPWQAWGQERCNYLIRPKKKYAATFHELKPRHCPVVFDSTRALRERRLWTASHTPPAQQPKPSYTIQLALHKGRHAVALDPSVSLCLHPGPHHPHRYYPFNSQHITAPSPAKLLK